MVILVGTLSVGACAFLEPEKQDLVEVNIVSGGLTKQANYTNLKFVIAGNCRVNYYNNHNHMLNVKLRYAHVQLALETNWEFSLDADGEGVFAVNVVVDRATKYYYTSMGWDYASEF